LQYLEAINIGWRKKTNDDEYDFNAWVKKKLRELAVNGVTPAKCLNCGTYFEHRPQCPV